MSNLGFPVSSTMRLVDLVASLTNQGLCLYWDATRRTVVVAVIPS